MDARVVIVGGGLSGLALGYELSRRGVRATVLEEGERPGGKIGTGREGAWQWEMGPNGVLDRDGSFDALARALGVDGRVLRASAAEKTRYVYARGRLWPVKLSPKMLLGGPLTLGGRLRLLLEPLSRRAQAADESIADFGRRHVGREAVARLLDPMVSGIYAGDVEQLSLPASFPRMAALEARSRSLVFGAIGALRRARAEGRVAVGASLSSFDGGMRVLTDALAERLGDAVRTRARARSIRRGPDGRWVIGLDDGEASADVVVLCAPAYAQAELVGPVDADAARALGEVPYAAMAVVHLGFPASVVERVPQAFGFLAASSERLPILGAVFASMLYAGRAPDGSHLFTCMAGGAHDPGAVGEDDAALVRRATEGLGRALGIVGTPTFSRVVRWPRAIPQYTVGHLARVAAVEAAERRHRGLLFGGNSLRGIGVSDCIGAAPKLAERVVAALGAS